MVAGKKIKTEELGEKIAGGGVLHPPPPAVGPAANLFIGEKMNLKRGGGGRIEMLNIYPRICLSYCGLSKLNIIHVEVRIDLPKLVTNVELRSRLSVNHL